MSGSNASQSPSNAALGVELELDTFGQTMLEQQCGELSVSAQELVRFALLYYLADLDSGRISRRIPQAPAPSKAP